MTVERTYDRVTLPHLGNQVLRMGVAANGGLESEDITYAAERGVNLWLYGRSFGKATAPLKDLLAREREKHVVVMLGTFVLTARGARRTVEKARRELGIDTVDLFLMPWLGRTSRFSPAIQDALADMREAGLVRGVGTSIHDRERAGRLAADSILDAFMLRYNAKHPGAETDVFPHLAKRDPIVISYTATSWRQLLKPLQGAQMPPWPGAHVGAAMPPLTAPMCYRFVLNSPHVHATWTAPGNRQELDENLAALDAGPLSAEEEVWVREYGKQVKSKRKRDYV
ncbi:MAG: aldo/keto reductase [Gemmatimonadetes bacterium]|nr:aldo/keto reductase [Gemmatimonadota bacterium]MBT5056906.1 aldo/keto reductase [Gemmatimonadota bacterium]MBT5141258.1 aldo/keto reductase [Gemmatimonadota bacterium]MBT5590339.1 aldo/keto reductase [Gemmatimonadota bacterium]MBT5963872.1 aldo/keto reductase [Gemmatimonadota bacterium]